MLFLFIIFLVSNLARSQTHQYQKLVLFFFFLVGFLERFMIFLILPIIILLPLLQMNYDLHWEKSLSLNFHMSLFWQKALGLKYFYAHIYFIQLTFSFSMRFHSPCTRLCDRWRAMNFLMKFEFQYLITVFSSTVQFVLSIFSFNSAPRLLFWR